MKNINNGSILVDSYWVDNCICLFYSLYLLWGLQPFFTWSSFLNGAFKQIGPVLYTSLFFIICLLLFLLKNKNGLLKYKKFEMRLCFGILIAAIMLLGVCGGKYELLASGSVIPYLMLILYFLFPDIIKVKIYKTFLILVAVSLIPAIIIYILNIAGIHIPYSILASYEAIKVNGNIQYKLYPFAVQLYSYNPLTELRMCGIYDEAGKLGTICALFLVSEQYKIRNNKLNFIILIAGILSFSLSFYLFTIIYFLCVNIANRKVKNAAALALIIVLYVAFTNIEINNPVFETLQSRMIITSNGLSGDNRTNMAYDQLFKEFQNADIGHLLFGFGDGAIGKIQAERFIDGSSYKSLLYNYGYIGFGFSIFWLLYFARKMIKRNKNNTIFILIATLIYIVNIYQRPSVFFPSYMIIFIGGVYYACAHTSIESRRNIG